MGMVGRIGSGLVLIGLLSMGIAAGTSSRRGEEQPPKILVEARIVQISETLWVKLGVGDRQAHSKDVTIPLASLLYALGEPNAVRTIASAQAAARVGQTEVVQTGAKMKFLMATPGGTLEPETTDTPIGTSLTIRPLEVRDGGIQVQVEFTHSQAQRPAKVDLGSSLPIGPPIVNSHQHLKTELHLTSGEPMIAGGMSASNDHTYIVIRAQVVSN